MTFFYSGETKGFYVDSIHGVDIPDDAFEVSDGTYMAMMEGQQHGKTINLVEGTLTLCDPSEEKSPQRYASAIAARRYRAEIAGISVGGTSISTSRDSQFLISSVALSALQNESYSCYWKASDGRFIELVAQQILAIASAVRSHVQACFDREAELLAHLDAGTYEDSMLDQGWPA